MRVTDALGQIAQIHDHLARAEQYRGLHPIAVAGSGLAGVLAAALQRWVVPADDPAGFVFFWFVVAFIGGTSGSGPAVEAYIRREDEFARRRTRRVLFQFLPCVVAGLCVTLALYRSSPDVVRLFPGLWAVLFAIGVFSARPYLPRAIGWVALFYIIAGATLLAIPPVDLARAGWAVGLTFTIGQAGTGAVLWRNQERELDG
ncbi:MAG TPA: hypothetical protein VH120_09340 [Gemmataceae bacterium]|nr:hypothetical protein [Gemmataceae bacterium]